MSRPAILIVDRNELFTSFRELIEEVGYKLGYEVFRSTSVTEALRLLHWGEFKLCVGDPDIIGHSVNDFTVPKVAITTLDTPEYRQKLRRQGYKGQLVRHYSRDEIAFIINTAANEKLVSRRAFPRVVAGFAAEVDLGFEHSLGELVTVSEGGAFLRAFDVLPKDRQFRLRFQLPRHETDKEPGFVEATSQVVYSQNFTTQPSLMSPGMGLVFTHLAAESRKQLATYVQDHLM